MHEQFFNAALEQAKLGLGVCAPNPCVGAVAVQNGNIIAQAFHNGAGTPHAEQLLLAQLPPKMPGVSIYITLEPCNHWGKTPPCVDAIIQYGLEHVFFAYHDPNPLVAQNNSAEKLRQHGIRVTHIPVQQIDDFYQSYTQWTLTGKPRVTVKIAQTLDGKIGYSEGERVILSNQLCADFTHEMRAASDIILTTERTISRDNPKLNIRLPNTEYAKPIAIVDSGLRLDNNKQIFSTASHCAVYHSNELVSPKANAKVNYYPMPMNNNHMDLTAVIKHLGELGYHDVWVEAGGALFTALHQARLVDRTYIYLVPASLGNKGISAYQQDGLFERKHRVSWHIKGNNVIACIDWLED